jgi:hypothetical protein
VSTFHFCVLPHRAELNNVIVVVTYYNSENYLQVFRFNVNIFFEFLAINGIVNVYVPNISLSSTL